MLQDSTPPEKPKSGSKVWIWALAGCGCLGFGVVLIGILSAIALPSFLNQANKARESEGRTYIGSLNRAQQAYYLENKAFSTSLEPLGLGISAETESYTYQVGVQQAQPPVAVNLATPAQEGLKGFIGLVFLTPDGNSDDLTTSAILCETEAPVSVESPMPSPLPAGFMECPAGFVALQ